MASRSTRSRRVISRPRSTRRWSTIRNSRAGSKSEHRPGAGETSTNWSAPRCSCQARLRPSSMAIRSMSMVGSPPVSRFVPLEYTMKAIVIHAARDLRVEEREPEVVGAGQVEVAVEAGGICGSDLHYFNHGGFGTVRVREPMILGHEVAGTIKALGTAVSGLAIGDRVAVSPSRPCNGCDYCLKGLQNQCLNMRFYGSAMPMPHIQGAFRQRLVAEAWQCHKVADGVSINEAAFAEPFAVVLHAVNRAGSLLGKRVLVTGCGRVGARAIVAARLHGAREIIATDVVASVLEKALQLCSDRAVNVAYGHDQLC